MLLIERPSLKGEARRFFSKIFPSSILGDPIKDSAPPRTEAVRHEREISHAGKSDDLRAGGNRQNKAILGITVIVPTSLVLDRLRLNCS